MTIPMYLSTIFYTEILVRKVVYLGHFLNEWKNVQIDFFSQNIIISEENEIFTWIFGNFNMRWCSQNGCSRMLFLAWWSSYLYLQCCSVLMLLWELHMTYLMKHSILKYLLNPWISTYKPSSQSHHWTKFFSSTSHKCVSKYNYF